MIEISSAIKADLERLIEIYSSPRLHQVTRESRWYVNCYFDYHHIVIAKVDGITQGSCFWRIEGEKVCGLGWIEDLWIEESHRKMGLGEALLRKAIEDMKTYFEEDGIELRRIALTCQEANIDAKNLYERIGFKKVAVLGELYEREKEDNLYVLNITE